MRTRSPVFLPLLCLLLLAPASPALADTIVARPLNTAGVGQYSNLGPGTHQQVADPFSLVGATSLESLLWYGRYDGAVAQTDFTFAIRLFADAGGAPALTPIHEAGVTVAGPLVAVGQPWRVYSSTLPGWTLGAGNYWLSIVENDPGTPAMGLTQWLWADTLTSGPRGIRHADTDPWVATTDINHAFTLEGRAVPEPGVLVLLGLGLVGLARRVRGAR